jgi:hypothetical protein
VKNVLLKVVPFVLIVDQDHQSVKHVHQDIMTMESMSTVNSVLRNSHIVLNVPKMVAPNVKTVESHQTVTVKTEQLMLAVLASHVTHNVKHALNPQTIVINVKESELDHQPVNAQMVIMKMLPLQKFAKNVIYSFARLV